MARSKTTKPESPRAKRKLSVTRRISQLESRMDLLELNVVQRLSQFETTVLQALGSFSQEEYKGRNIFRAVVIGIGVLIIAVLLGRMYGYLGV